MDDKSTADAKALIGVEATPDEIERININIRGHQLISKRLFDIVIHLIVANEVIEYDCINEIIFSEDEPKDKYGGFDIETKDITINLQKHFDNAIEMVKDEELSIFSMRGHLWYGLLQTCIHEILHSMAFAIDPESMLNKDKETIEKEIRSEVLDHIEKLIRDYDMEPPLMDDEPFFGARYLEFYTKNIKDNTEQWAINQNVVHKSGFMWIIDEKTKRETFREWYRSTENHAGNTEWDKDPEPLHTLDLFEEVPTSTVETETVISPSAEVIEALPAESHTCKCGATIIGNAMCTQCGPTEAEVMGIDPELLAFASMDMEEPIEINMEDAVMTESATVKPYAALAADSSLGPAPAPVQQPLPLKEIAPTTLCRNCTTTLTDGMNFCGGCGTSVVATPMPTLPLAVVEVATTQPQSVSDISRQQFSSGAKRPMRHDLPNYNLSAEQIRACVGEVLIRCYQHIFSKCGFLPAQNPSFAPELRNAVMEPISIVGIPCVDQILVGMDSVDSLNGNFTWCVPAVEGMIRGKITKNLGLPSYTLYFNFNGHEAKRIIMPQNQWKVGTSGGYSGPANRAQQGATIIWMMDGDDSVPGQKWRAKIENGSLEWLI